MHVHHLSMHLHHVPQVRMAPDLRFYEVRGVHGHHQDTLNR